MLSISKAQLLVMLEVTMFTFTTEQKISVTSMILISTTQVIDSLLQTP